MNALKLIAVGLGIALASVVHAQSGVFPVVVEAESGTLGADFATQTDLDTEITYMYPTNDHGDVGTASEPGSAGRVVTYSATFPRAGVYNIYYHFAVGDGVGSDDSFFIALDTPDPLSSDGWSMCNNLWSVGYNEDAAVVEGEGSNAAGEGFRWINLSAWDQCQFSITVEEGELTRSFSYGARENGLSVDKFAFGLQDDLFTVEDLTIGRASTGKPPRDPSTPIAQGKEKTLGGAYSASQNRLFSSFFNLVVPENAGKWGSVEGTRDSMGWDTLDTAYNLAETGGDDPDSPHHDDTVFPMPFRMHVLLWGNQQPAWIEDLTPEEQLEEITEWFDAVAERYPNIDYLEVVNEPVNDPPAGEGNGNYIDALGGAADNAWLKTAYSMARERFPEAQLVINEYNVLSNEQTLETYKAMIEDLQADDLVDVIGVQAHAFSTRGTAESIQSALDSLAETGLPIHITEMDVDGAELVGFDESSDPIYEADDLLQLEDYKKIFKTVWEHDAVESVTLWGFRPGLWRTDTMANIVLANDDDRPAATWLRTYVAGDNQPPVITSETTVAIDEEVLIGTNVMTLTADDPDGENESLGNWTIVGGTGLAYFDVEPETGELFVALGAFLDYEKQSSFTLDVKVMDEVYLDSAVTTVTINLNDIENDGEAPEVTIWPEIEDGENSGGGSFNFGLLALLALMSVALRRSHSRRQ